MKLRQLFTKTSKDIPSGETSHNAQLLLKAGFVYKTNPGIYAFLPLGYRVLNKIENIVRKNMNSIGGQEVLMNNLIPKEYWQKADRWDVDIAFKTQGQNGTDYALAYSNEETVTPIAKQFISSYKDLPDFDPEKGIFPMSIYHINTKFRNELRAKAGLLRGREFRMKDLYDFHKTKESQEKYYNLMIETYNKTFAEMGLKSYPVAASGGIFSKKYSHEFQVICKSGEDKTFIVPDTNFAYNQEVAPSQRGLGNAQEGDIHPETGKKYQVYTTAEVGNIYDLGTKFTEAFGIKYADENNQEQVPYMGCHGIGTSRCMAVIADIYNDENGLKWPENVAPYKYHLITNINPKDSDEVKNQILGFAQEIYQKYPDNVLWDDREGISVGSKLKDADLIGCPTQLIITARSLQNGGVEVRSRENGETKVVSLGEIV